MNAQTGYVYGNNNYYRYNYNQAGYNNWDRAANNYGARYLPVDVRRRLNRLERRLAERKRCALEDGYISRREARRINDVQRDIDELLFSYRRNSYPYGNRRICR